jgi:hypothetical protein
MARDIVRVLDLSDDQAVDFESDVQRARELAEPGGFPLLTVRPTGDPSTALHVIVLESAKDTPLNDSAAAWARQQAPDAVRHAFLGSIEPGIDRLLQGPTLLTAPR